MRYTLREPCDECPFLIGSGFTFKSLQAHASGEFPCHKQCKLDAEDNFVPRGKKTQHCAGALIFLEKRGQPHQMMRIMERLRLYDPRTLRMDAPVVSRPSQCRRSKQPE